MAKSMNHDTQIVLSAMSDAPVTSLELAEKTGLSAGTVGALLRNAKKKGLTQWLGEKPVKRNGHWQMISVWGKVVQVKVPSKLYGIDQADLDWMAYWNNRRLQRLQHRIAHE